MPPHAILATADILYEIFQHLRIPIPTGTDGSLVEIQEKQRTLSQAARVSKAFRDPALRTLWWAMPSGIEPALMLLSAVAVVQIPPPEWAMQGGIYSRQYDVSLEGEISAPDWARFTTYAAYVRIIYNTKCSPHRIPPNLLSSLRAVNNNGPLFPHLKQFTWDTSTLHQTDLSLFAPTGLQKLTIDASEAHGSWSLYWRTGEDRHKHPMPFDFSDFDRAIQDLPGLLALDFRRFPASSRTPPTVWALIVQLRRLRFLSLDSLYYPVFDMGFLRKLSQLPALLGLGLSVLPDWEAPHCDLAFRGFLALQALTLRVHDRIPTTVLSVFASPLLVSLSLESFVQDPSTIPDVLNLVAGTYRKLRCVTFEWPHAAKTYTTPDLDDFDAVFGGLLHLNTIEEFTIRTPDSLFISAGADAELARLAQSWPKLRILSLYTTLLGPLTHAALLPFARYCPELHTLGLRSVSFIHLTAEKLAATVTPRHGLQELHIENALVDYPSEALSTQFIQRLFPNVRWSAR